MNKQFVTIDWWYCLMNNTVNCKRCGIWRNWQCVFENDLCDNCKIERNKRMEMEKMEDFKVGDIVYNESSYQAIMLKDLCEVKYMMSLKGARHATKEEKIQYYRKIIDENEKNLQELICDMVHMELDGEDWQITEKQANKIQLMLDMEQFVKEKAPDWVPDWSPETEQAKYGIFLDEGECVFNCEFGISTSVFGLNVPTREICLEMLSLFRERIEKWY